MNVRAPSRLSPVRYVTVWINRGIDERGAAGALPGAAEGRRVPDPVRRPADRRTRPQQWNDAVHTLLALQDQYREWRDALPESLAGSATAELLEQVCDLDLSVLEAVELPRGFGRDG